MRRRIRGQHNAAAAPIIPKPPRTRWQFKRDTALRNAGFTKADVWKQAQVLGSSASRSGVGAVIDGRYHDRTVIAAFIKLIHPRGTREGSVLFRRLVNEYFPEDEPAYRTHNRRALP